MLFNSFSFLLVFLPLTCAGFFGLARHSRAAAALWLTLASLAFYGWWNPVYVLLLVVSICFNYVAARLIYDLGRRGETRTQSWIFFGAVSADIALLAYYKYAAFFVHNLAALSGQGWTIESVALPLGISFFTFTQIAFLVDTWRGEVESFDPLHYALFVTYFPHLVAGPILHHRSMIPQFSSGAMYRFDADNFAVGLTIFAAGLFKKVICADSIARYADPVFDAAGATALSVIDAWGGALAYTLQIYFDFSGYSDMAIGLSMLFGVRIPINFDSPYKAISIIDFWRRWHISLSTFLRDYLYIPLGGNRHGRARRHLNLMLTMLLGGLWHGAGWTFVIWGGLHGGYLIANHAWRAMRGPPPESRGILRTWCARLVTMLAVVVAWVFFRAESVDAALSILRGMAGMNGIALPESWAPKLGALGVWLAAHQVRFEPMPLFGLRNQVLMTIALFGVVWATPNVRQWMLARTVATGGGDGLSGRWRTLCWQPSLTHALVASAMLGAGLLMLYFSSGSEFIYYNF